LARDRNGWVGARLKGVVPALGIGSGDTPYGGYMGRSEKGSVHRQSGYNPAMGVVELLQDLVTPEMRALAVKSLNEKIDSLRTEMNRRFDYIESSFRLDERVSLLEAERRKQHPQQ
jgi:hypothetical protein